MDKLRVDEGLKKASKPVLIDLYGSVCRGIESYLAGLVATYEAGNISGVHPSHTVNIENFHVERNLRTRRRLVVEEETEVTATVTCVFCDKIASYEVFLGRGTKQVCDVHFLEAKVSGNLRGYRPLEARRF